MDQTILFPTNIPAHVQLSDELRNEINQAQKMDYNSEEHAILPFADAIGNFGTDLINYEFLSTHMQDIFHVVHPADPAIAAAEQAAREAEQLAATQRVMRRRLREQENQKHAQNIAPTHARRQLRRNRIDIYYNQQREAIKRAEEMARMGDTIRAIEESFTQQFADTITANNRHNTTNTTTNPAFRFIPDRPPTDLRTVTHEGVVVFGQPDKDVTEHDGVRPGRIIFHHHATHAALPYYHTEIISPENYRRSIIAFIRPTPHGWAIIPVLNQQYQRDLRTTIQESRRDIGVRLQDHIKQICNSLVMHEYASTAPWSDEEFANLCAQYTNEITKAIKEKDARQYKSELSSRENHMRESMEHIQRMQYNIDITQYDIQQSKNQLLERHQKMQQLLQCFRTDKHITYAFIQNERYDGNRYATLHLHMNPETFPESPHILLRISQYNDQQCNAYMKIQGLADDHPLAQKYLPITVLEQCNQALKDQKITQFLRNLRRIINNPERI